VLFHESFEGRENENLTDELLTELSGILNWAIEGWRRLRAKGKFILPPTSVEALERMKKKAAPMLNFVEEECEIGSELSWQRNACYAHYVACCEASNNKPLSRPKFVEAMEDLNLGIKCRRLQAAPGETKRPYVFVGIGKLGKARREATILKMPQPAERETSRASTGCQSASNRPPGSARKRDPLPALGQARPGSEQEGPARVAQCPHE
jgi:phage/plasmid-associated DNA primase